MMPGTLECICRECGETFIPDQESKIQGARFDDLPQELKRESGDWWEHYERESGQPCGGVGTLTAQSWARLRHPATRPVNW